MLLNLLAVVQEAAEPAAAGGGLAQFGAGLAIGLSIIGAGLGLGWIGSQAAQSIARQPEAVDGIRGIAILIGVLLEGVTIISLVFALLYKIL